MCSQQTVEEAGRSPNLMPEGAGRTFDTGSFLANITNQIRPAGGCLY